MLDLFLLTVDVDESDEISLRHTFTCSRDAQSVYVIAETHTKSSFKKKIFSQPDTNQTEVESCFLPDI